MARSKNSRKGIKKATPSRVRCTCNNPDCDVQVDKGKFRFVKSRTQRRGNG